MAHELSRIITISALIAACMAASACGGTAGAASGDKSVRQATPSIAPYTSSIDKDGDGVDDQSDILQSARAYIATKPAYKSEYYATGYPNDGYGVCTDVVGAALRGAGYDLMTLVHEDILAHPERYAIDTPDANIDFRRVPVLNAYFAAHAINLTTDTTDVGAWQGGDIVVYSNHIGIASDTRNADGLPLLIHHVSAKQKQYEEDALGTFSQQLVGHYRIS
ncbi:DUF1287 domain-containing protein [Bifidobacterium criceti]|uniref:DUF1287 domain-containing protein n=1 Tax=Bifidobacterium criceti TaxID=1960969 RepID=A0A2A2EFS5_9BIFI|nr:DUF1287 domain-containing protein [Bifidobacterium criceti]PAU67755.1 hypothetical protein B1526_0992 [Bifidobacterium criceti]